MLNKWLDKLNRHDYPFIDLFYYLIVIVVFFLLVIISNLFLINQGMRVSQNSNFNIIHSTIVFNGRLMKAPKILNIDTPYHYLVF